MAPTWKCSICGVVVEGAQAPAHCPECGARREMFAASDEEPHEVPHNPIQPHDNHPGGAFAPGSDACFEED